MDRDTKQVLISKHAFHIKTYATAREAQAIQQAYFKGTRLEVVGELPRISEFNPGVRFDVEQELIRQLVVAMDDGVAEVPHEQIVDRCLELPSEEYDELIEELDRLTSKKKKSPNP